MTESPEFDITDVYKKESNYLSSLSFTHRQRRPTALHDSSSAYRLQPVEHRVSVHNDYCNVVQLRNCSGKQMCVSVYNNDTLATFYEKAEKLLVASKMIYYDANATAPAKHQYTSFSQLTDFIPLKNYNHTADDSAVELQHVSSPLSPPCENKMYELFVCDNNDKPLMIPRDGTIIFGDFKRNHKTFFIPSKRVPILSVYTVYILDDNSAEFVKKITAEKQQSSFYTLKRLFSCKI